VTLTPAKKAPGIPHAISQVIPADTTLHTVYVASPKAYGDALAAGIRRTSPSAPTGSAPTRHAASLVDPAPAEQ
jgi:hypothetical protein